MARWYVFEKAERGLKAYRYRGCDSSICAEALNPFWEWFLRRLPRWLAPNLITFIGFLCAIVGFIWMMLSHPQFGLYQLPYVPRAVTYIGTAVLLFLYQTFDAVDGKQARRTGTSSPLGELFDHGCDSFVTTLQAAIGVAMMGLGIQKWSFWSFVLVLTAAYSFLWEEFITLELEFGKFNSVTEMQMSVMVGLIATGIFGQWIWSVDLLGLIPGVPYHLKLVYLYISVVSLLGIVQFINSYRTITKHIKAKGVDVTRRGLTIPDALYMLVHLSWVDAWFVSWFFLERGLASRHMMLFCLSYSFSVSYLMARIVVARITEVKMDRWYWIEVPLPFLVLLSHFYVSEATSVYFLWGYVGFLALLTLHFAYFMLLELCEVLKLNLFTIPKHKYDESVFDAASDELDAFESEGSETPVE